jgi:hypothetical protein
VVTITGQLDAVAGALEALPAAEFASVAALNERLKALSASHAGLFPLLR